MILKEEFLTMWPINYEKTNVTVNLGIGLAREGKKVALIDNDAQGSLTASLA